MQTGNMTHDAQLVFEEIFFATKDRLFSYIRKFLKDRMLAEDVLQQCYLKLWENLNKIVSPDNALPLLCTYAKHLIVDACRKEARKLRYIAENQPAADPVCHADEDLTAKEYKRLIQKALDKLPDTSKKVFMLKREQGLSYLQIAEVLCVTPGAVESHMSRALKLLKKELKNSITISMYLIILDAIR